MNFLLKTLINSKKAILIVCKFINIKLFFNTSQEFNIKLLIIKYLAQKKAPGGALTS